MRTVLILLIALSSRAVTGEWTRQLEVNGGLRDVHFLNDSVGVVAGAGIYRTGNGGTNWERVYGDDEPNGSEQFKMIRIFNEHDIWAISYLSSVDDGIALISARSSDGGKTWRRYRPVIEAPNSYSRDLYVSVLDYHNALAITQGRKLIRTRDGGETWEDVYTDSAVTLVQAVMLSGAKWEISARDASASVTISTSDSGRSWQRRETTRPEPGFYTYCYNEAVWYYVDNSYLSQNNVYRSTDAGISWERVSQLPFTDRVTHVNMQFVSESEGWMIAGRYSVFYVLHTTNGGRTWSKDPEASTLMYSPSALQFTRNGCGWIVGSHDFVVDNTSITRGVVINYRATLSNVEEKFSADEFAEVILAENLVEIKFNTEKIHSLNIYDALGNPIMSQTHLYQRKKISMSTAHLASGLYFVTLQSGEKIISKKFCVVR